MNETARERRQRIASGGGRVEDIPDLLSIVDRMRGVIIAYGNLLPGLSKEVQNILKETEG